MRPKLSEVRRHLKAAVNEDVRVSSVPPNGLHVSSFTMDGPRIEAALLELGYAWEGPRYKSGEPSGHVGDEGRWRFRHHYDLFVWRPRLRTTLQSREIPLQEYMKRLNDALKRRVTF